MGHLAAGHGLVRGSRYYLRCRVPTGVVARLGRREIVRTLRTSDRRRAAALAAGIAVRLPLLWQRVTAALEPTPAQIAEMVNRWLREEFDRQWRLLEAGPVDEAILGAGKTYHIWAENCWIRQNPWYRWFHAGPACAGVCARHRWLSLSVRITVEEHRNLPG